MINQVRDCGRPVLVLDAGGAFGAAGGVSDSEARLRAEYAMRGMEMCGYDAMGLGDEEFRFGEVFLGEQTAATHMPVLAANLYYLYDGGTPYAPGYTTLTVGETTVGVISVVSTELGAAIEESSASEGVMVTVGDPAAAIATSLAAMDPTDIVVVLAHMTRDEALELALSVSDVDVIVAAHDKVLPSLAVESGDALVLSTGYEGKWVARLDLRLDADQRIDDYTSEAVMLDGRFEDDPALAALYEEFLARAEADSGVAESVPANARPAAAENAR